MRHQWISAAFLSAILAVGCGDGGQQTTQNPDANGAAPATGDTAATAPPASPGADNSAASPDSSGVSSTPQSRPAPAPRASGSTRTETSRDLNTREPAADRSAESRETTTRENAVPVVREVTVPAGTVLPLELLTALSSETAAVETPVRARLRQSVNVGGLTALPAGTVLNGTVTEVARAGRVQGRSRLAFRFDSATVNGVRENLRTNPVAFEGEASKGDDAKKIGVGAGIGAAIGAIAGGGSGAAKGAAIGGAAGTGAVLATRGKEVELGEGADISATLSESVTVEAR